MVSVRTGLEKAAAILVCLGLEKSAQVLSHLTLDDVELLSDQMARIGHIPREQKHNLLTDLRDLYDSGDWDAATGDLGFVRRLLSATFGEDRASAVLEQLLQPKAARPFQTLRGVDSSRILDIINGEHPGVAALMLYYLPREKAAQVLSGLPDVIRMDVVMRLANLRHPVPHMVARLEQLLNEKLSETHGEHTDDERDLAGKSGARTLVEILSQTDPGVERRVYEHLQERDPELAEEVRKSMFVFEDLVKLDPMAVQTVLREVSSQELALALKNAPDSLRELVYGNVSSNTARTIQEELELMGPIRVTQVEEAQEKVVSVVRALADAGTITLRVAEEDTRMI